MLFFDFFILGGSRGFVEVFLGVVLGVRVGIYDFGYVLFSL